MDAPRAIVVVENGRLRLRIAGRDLAGRGGGEYRFPVGAPLGAGRALGVADTLTYSLGGKVLLHDTVSESRTGIVRILDSTFNPAIVYGYLTDSRDGQIYRTVKIGTQTWMAQNLNYKVDSSWWYEASADNGAKYGRLYSWTAALKLPDSCSRDTCAGQVQPKHQGVCPTGWHVPSDAEWSTFESYVGGDSMAGTKLKSTSGWIYRGTPGNGTDEYGFHALPGGVRYSSGGFCCLGESGNFWVTREQYEDYAWYRYVDSCNDGLRSSHSILKKYGSGVRCLKDAP